MRRLPPLKSLQAFEAAGRRLSFTDAASELNVTPGAISQQIRLLEELTQTLPNRTAFWHTLAQTYAEHDLNESALRARETAANLNPEWNP